MNLRRTVPALLAGAVAVWWIYDTTATTLVIFGLMAVFLGFERAQSDRHRPGDYDDLVHLTLTTALVRITGVELVVGALRELGDGAGAAALPIVARLVVVLLVFDLVDYIHHRVMHDSTLLWPFHQVHHSVDRVHVAMKARRHPVEDLFVIVSFGAAGFLIGADDISLRFVGVLTTVHGMAIHSTIGVRPSRLDAVVVTPWTHHRHHGSAGHHRDFAGVFPIWDHLFGSRGAGAPSAPGIDDPMPPDWWGQMARPFRRVGTSVPSD